MSVDQEELIRIAEFVRTRQERGEREKRLYRTIARNFLVELGYKDVLEAVEGHQDSKRNIDILSDAPSTISPEQVGSLINTVINGTIPAILSGRKVITDFTMTGPKNAPTAQLYEVGRSLLQTVGFFPIIDGSEPISVNAFVYEENPLVSARITINTPQSSIGITTELNTSQTSR